MSEEILTVIVGALVIAGALALKKSGKKSTGMVLSTVLPGGEGMRI